jgi:adenylate cyclase
MRYRFGQFVFDTGRRELTRAGAVVSLQPKAFRLLEVLLEAGPCALSKQQLHDRIWPDIHVSDASLTRLMSDLRRLLREPGRESRLVRTIQGYGYAFAGEVTSEEAGERPRDVRDPWPVRIAVPPFVDLSPQRDQGYFCEGIADELISVLTALPGLQVASRQSSFRYAAAGLDVRSIGAELDARAVLEGTVRKAAELLRITARLLDVGSGYYLWSQSFDRAPDEVFEIQDEIVRRVARALGLSSGAADESPPRLPTPSLEGYEMYLRGRQQFHRMLRESLEAARRLYRRALELALRLNPRLYQACYFYGRSWVSRGDLGRAAHWFERAAATDPDAYDALNLLAMARLGLQDGVAAKDALQLTLRAVQKHLDLEPDEVRPLALGAQALAGLGERSRAVEWALRAQRLAGDDPGSLWNIGAALALAGETSDALSCLESALLHCRDLAWADHDSFLDGVRGERRFQAALAAAWERRGGRP